jgi:hypothetical protein
MKDGLFNKLILISMLVFLSATFNAWAEEEGPAVSADAGVFSKYIWRGYELNHDSIVIQPSITISDKGFGVNGWANIDTDPEGDNAWNETDLTLSYETGIGPVTLGGGYIYYNVKAADDTQELYIKAGYDTFLSPALTVYRDIDLTPGYYFNLGLSHSINVTEDISLDLSGGIGYYISCDKNIIEAGTNKKYNGFQDGLLSAGLTIPLNKQMTLSPSVSYSFALSDKAKALLGMLDKSSNTFGGIVFSYVF